MSIRARQVFVPGLSAEYQERISRTRGVSLVGPFGGAVAGATAAWEFIVLRSIGRVPIGAQGPGRSGFPQGGVPGGADHGGALLQDHPDGHGGEERLEMVLPAKRVKEGGALERG